MSREQLEAAMATTRRQAASDGAKRGMNMTLDRMQNSPAPARALASDGRKFPDMQPTTRRFTMGDYPNKVYRSLSGATFRRNFGNKTGYRLSLSLEILAIFELKKAVEVLIL